MKARIKDFMPCNDSRWIVQTTKEGNLTNGAWLLKPEFITPAIEKRLSLPNVLSRDEKKVSDSEVWPHEEKLRPAVKMMIEKDGQIVCETGDGEKVKVNSGYLLYLNKAIKNMRVFIHSSNKPVVLKSGDKTAGLLAFMRH